VPQLSKKGGHVKKNSPKTTVLVTLSCFFMMFGGILNAGKKGVEKTPLIFISCVEYPVQIPGSLLLAESIRTFAGSLKDAPIRIYFPERIRDSISGFQKRLSVLGVDLKPVQVPEKAFQFALGAKAFSAAQAESYAVSETSLLVFMDPNTILIDEPKEVILSGEKIFAYSPVHHRNIGSAFYKPPDAFWSRLFQTLNVPESAMFPVKSLADNEILRPYFNAGSFVVRPEAGILKKWRECFTILVNDPDIAEMSKEGKYNIFLHQAAFSAAVLKTIKQEKMILLSEKYNYPLFFEKFYGSELKFDSIEGVVTLRIEFNKKNLPPDWDKKIKGPEKVISWIKTRFSMKKT
jgi:hypothetical protein